MCVCVCVRESACVSQLLTMTRMFASNSVHTSFSTALAPREGGTKLEWRRGRREGEDGEGGKEGRGKEVRKGGGRGI